MVLNFDRRPLSLTDGPSIERQFRWQSGRIRPRRSTVRVRATAPAWLAPRTGLRPVETTSRRSRTSPRSTLGRPVAHSRGLARAGRHGAAPFQAARYVRESHL